MNRIRALVLASLLVMAVLVVPGVGFAQDDDGDCYPPAGPECDGEEDGGRAVAVECDLDASAREVECTGEGFEPESTAELELQRRGDVVADASTTVGEDGTFVVAAELPCDYDDDRVLARVSGTDDQGRPVTFTEQVDVSDAEPCDEVLSGSQERSGAAGGDGGGGLALTGTDWLLLIAAALALIAVGTWLVRRRREGGSTRA